MLYCGCRTLVGYDVGGRTAIVLPCKCWTCERCRRKRKSGLVALAMRGLPNKFITLTIRRTDGITVADAAQILTDGFKEIRRRIVRKQGCKSPEFLAVFEATEAGWPHLHILARAVYISQSWLADEWEKITGHSRVVDIRAVRSRRQAAGYVSKYVGKAPGKFGTHKRYWTSRKYDLSPGKPERPVADSATKWEVQPGHINPIVAAWKEGGMNVTWRSVYEARAEHPS